MVSMVMKSTSTSFVCRKGTRDWTRPSVLFLYFAPLSRTEQLLSRSPAEEAKLCLILLFVIRAPSSTRDDLPAFSQFFLSLCLRVHRPQPCPSQQPVRLSPFTMSLVPE